MNEQNSTTNTVLVVLLVIVVGFIVWFVMDRRNADTDTKDGSSLEINLGDDDSNGTGSNQ